MSPGGSAKPDTFATINDDIPLCQRHRAAGVCPYMLADELLNRATAGSFRAGAPDHTTSLKVDL